MVCLPVQDGASTVALTSTPRYGKIKDTISKTRGSGTLRSSDYFLASGASGILTAFFTNPIWVVKTRMLSTSRDHPGAYKSTWEGTKLLYQSEGMKGFYRGLIPSLFGVSHGAIQFMAYEQLKNHWAVTRGGKEKLTNLDFLELSAVSKMFAGSITYPYQVVRARLQVYDANQRYKNARDVCKQVFRNEGIVGFYKGYVMRARTQPTSRTAILTRHLQPRPKPHPRGALDLRDILGLRKHEVLPSAHVAGRRHTHRRLICIARAI